MTPSASPIPQPFVFRAPMYYHQAWQQGISPGKPPGEPPPADGTPVHAPVQAVHSIRPPLPIMAHRDWLAGQPIIRPGDPGLPGTLHGNLQPGPGWLPAAPLYQHSALGWSMPVQRTSLPHFFATQGTHSNPHPQLASPFEPVGLGTSLPPPLSKPYPTEAREPSLKSRQPMESCHLTQPRVDMPWAAKLESLSDTATTAPVLPCCPIGEFPQPLNPQTFDPLAAWYKRHYAPSKEKTQPTEEEVDSRPAMPKPTACATANPLQRTSKAPAPPNIKDGYTDPRMGLEPYMTFEPVRPRKQLPCTNQPSASGIILEDDPEIRAPTASRITRASVQWWRDVQQCFGPAVLGAREIQPGGPFRESAERGKDVHIDAAAGSNLTGGGITMVGSCGSTGDRHKSVQKRPRDPRTKVCARRMRQKRCEKSSSENTVQDDNSGGSRYSSPPHDCVEDGEVQNASTSPCSSPQSPHGSKQL